MGELRAESLKPRAGSQRQNEKSFSLYLPTFSFQLSALGSNFYAFGFTLFALLLLSAFSSLLFALRKLNFVKKLINL